MLVELQNTRLGAWLIDSSLSELNVKKYSAFKHGRSGVAAEYASDIFCRVLRDRLAKEISFSLLLSPSSYLPTASHAIAIALYQLMRKKGYRVRLVKVQRNCTYSVDYGKLNSEERMSLIKGDKFTLEEQFEAEEQLLFVDDVSISGAHQFVLENMLAEHQIQNKVYFLYYAIVNDVSLDSSIEGVMNNALVKDIRDLPQLMIEPGFVLNTRVVKLILNSAKLEEEWLNEIPLSTLREIVVGARGNDYHEMTDYVKNLQIIEQSLKDREKDLC